MASQYIEIPFLLFKILKNAFVSLIFCWFRSHGRQCGMSPLLDIHFELLSSPWKKKNSRHAAASHLIISREFIVGASPFSRGRRGTGRQSVFVITTQRPCHKVKWRQRTHTPVGSVYILAFRTYKERVRSIKGKAYTHTGCVCVRVWVCTIELQCSCSHCIGRRWSTTKSFRLWYLDKRLFNFATLQLSIPLLFIGHSFFILMLAVAERKTCLLMYIR